jgi:hypothetical protein
MNPDQTPLVNKLTLLVLCLILVCLVLLVGRAYQNTRPAVETAAVAEAETAPAAVEETWPAPPPPQTRPLQPPRRPSTNNTRGSLPARVQQPVNGTAPDALFPVPAQYTEASAALVNVSEGEYAGVPGVSVAIDGSGTSLGGWVFLVGTPKPEIPIDLGPTCSALNPGKVTTRHFVVSREGALANVLVYVQNASPGKPLTPPPVLDQIGCMFEPYVLGVVAGQEFRIRNSDPTLHNIHATPKINREFNFAQPSRGHVTTKSFSKPELFVRLKCDVHPWMFAYVNVLPHPFFAITDTNGVFRLPPGLPAGDYTVSAVHLKAGELTRQVTISDDGWRPISFHFSATSVAKPQGGVVKSH